MTDKDRRLSGQEGKRVLGIEDDVKLLLPLGFQHRELIPQQDRRHTDCHFPDVSLVSE
jgi:hypothetical protein